MGKLSVSDPVLKISNHSNHGWGPKEFGGTKEMLLYLLVIVLSLKFRLWSPQNHCSVPQIPFMVPRKQLFCPLKFQIICCPLKIVVLSPQIPFQSGNQTRWTLTLSSFRRCMICGLQCWNRRNVAVYWGFSLQREEEEEEEATGFHRCKHAMGRTQSVELREVFR